MHTAIRLRVIYLLVMVATVAGCAVNGFVKYYKPSPATEQVLKSHIQCAASTDAPGL